MPMTTAELACPVIAICRKGFLEVREDEDTITTATLHKLKIRCFDNITIVDSNGKAVKVKGAKFLSGRGRFWGYTACLNRIAKIEVFLDDRVSDMPLDELKKKVLSFQRKSGGSMNPRYAREVLREFAEAQSIRKLIERFQPHMGMREFYHTLKKSLPQSPP